MSKKQMGFTLIEIVMVLVLLGILSAIAVPKYFDLKDKAEEKASAAVAAEVQARLNGSFADEVLNGADCKAARKTAAGEGIKALTENKTALENSYGTDKITYVGLTSQTNSDTPITEVKVGIGNYSYNISVPKCKGED